MARRNILLYIGATSIVASLVLRSTIGGDFTLVLEVVGGSVTLSFFALLSLSRIDVKWVGVRKGLNLSIALSVAGTAIVSAFALENMYAPSNPTTIPVAIFGIVVWLLGMVAWLYSLVRARGAFGSKMKPARSFYQILRRGSDLKTFERSDATSVYTDNYQPFDQDNGRSSSSFQSTAKDKFTGKRWSASTGLYYYHRWHDSSTGSFISPDPKPGALSNPQSLTPYTYVGNSPESGGDPSGTVRRLYINPFSLSRNRRKSSDKDRNLYPSQP